MPLHELKSQLSQPLVYLGRWQVERQGHRYVTGIGGCLFCGRVGLFVFSLDEIPFGERAGRERKGGRGCIRQDIRSESHLNERER